MRLTLPPHPPIQSAKIEKQKLRAVGLRNRATAEADTRRRLEADQRGAVAERKETLERLGREHASLIKVIAAQESEISKLSTGR